MSNILTQKEIDELLSKLTDGSESSSAASNEQDSPAYKLYDFRTANKFSKEQMRTLNNIFEHFAFLLSSRLTGMTRTICEVSLVSIEEQRFGEFNNSIPTPIVLAIVDALPFRAPILLEIAPGVIFGLMSRLFGGAADNAEPSKNFTEIELAMASNIISQILPVYEEAWEKVVEVKASLQRLETSPQFTQLTALNEPAAIITFDVKIDNIQDNIAICIPHFVIQPIEKKLNTKSWSIGEIKHDGKPLQDVVISKQLSNTMVSLTAVFDDLTVTFGDIMRMRVGDVICMDHSINQFITLKMEHIPKFRGIMGVCDQRQVIQIAEIIKENDNLE